MRKSTLLLVLCVGPTLACPRPTDTEAASAGAVNTEQPAPAPSSATSGQAPEQPLGDTAATSADSSASEAPADAVLKVDAEQSSVGFAVARATVGHLGEFEDFDASLTLTDGKPGKLQITVKTGSVEADRKGLTHHLQSADFFDVAKFPTATFTASEFTPDPEAGPDAYLVSGTMHLHGVERKLEFPATLEIGPERVVGRATLDISAKAFGIDYAGMEAELAEDAVQLEIELVFPRVAGP